MGEHSTGDIEGKRSVSAKHKDLERARNSIWEELSAINWYDERRDATKDKALKKVFKENADDEKEHTAKLIRWLKKNDPRQADWLKKVM